MDKKAWSISVLTGLLLALIAIHFNVPHLLLTSPEKALAQAGQTEDPATKDIVELMLNSHNTWDTLQGSVEVVARSPDGETQTTLFTFQIDQPDQFRVSKNGALKLISDGTTLYEVDLHRGIYARSLALDSLEQGMAELPVNLQQVQQNELDGIRTVYPHPVGATLGLVGSLVYPTGLAQRSGTYTLQSLTEIDARSVWVVDRYFEDSTGQQTLTEKLWIDTETGVILKKATYYGNSGEILEESTITDITFNEALDASAFTFAAQENLREVTPGEYRNLPDEVINRWQEMGTPTK